MHVTMTKFASSRSVNLEQSLRFMHWQTENLFLFPACISRRLLGICASAESPGKLGDKLQDHSRIIQFSTLASHFLHDNLLFTVLLIQFNKSGGSFLTSSHEMFESLQ